MLILHGIWRSGRNDLGGYFFLWAESSKDAIRKASNGAENPADHASHLYQASIEELMQACRFLESTTSPYASSTKIPSSDSIALLLPTVHGKPQASSPLVGGDEAYLSGEPKSKQGPLTEMRSKPSLAPWTVNGLKLDAEQATRFLIAFGDAPVRHLGEGTGERGSILLGSDLLFWSKVAKFLVQLLARQRFLPYISTITNASGKAKPSEKRARKSGFKPQISYRATWIPLLDDENDMTILRLLVEAMPPICRAVARNDQNNPRELAISFLREATDTIVKNLAASKSERYEQLRVARDSESVAARWYGALVSAGKGYVIEAPPAKLELLRSGLESWSSEIYSMQEESFRTCFRLEAPDIRDDGEDQGSSRPAASPWVLRYLLQATDDPTLLIPAETVWKESGQALSYFSRRLSNPQEKLLTDLGKASRLYPGVESSLRSSPTPCYSELSIDEAYTFLKEWSWLLKESGFGVLIPPKVSSWKVHVNVKTPQKVTKQGIFTLQALVDFDWKVALGDEKSGSIILSEEQFREIVSFKQPLIALRGMWIELGEDEVNSTLKFLDSYRERGGIPVGDVLKLASAASSLEGGIAGIEIVDRGGWINEMLEQITGKKEKLPELPSPKEFNGVLRPYQVRGFSWLAFMRRWGLGACLADDMGLGKTIELIALILHDKASKENESREMGPTLVICPTSLVGNWHREIGRFAPSLRVMIHHGPERLDRVDEFAKAVGRHDVVLTTYPLVQRDAELLSAIEWESVALDEAQNIKNYWTKQAHAVRGLRSLHRVSLTGTPIENRLSELWSIMEFLNPGYLGTVQSFRRSYAIAIEKYGDRERQEELQKIVQPFVLRRLKTDRKIIRDLPEKMEMKVFCNLTEEQASIYEAYVKEMLSSIESAEGIERKGLVLAALTRLKQICDHPALFSGDKSSLEGRSGKMERLREMLEEVIDEGDRALVFTQYVQMGELLKKHLQSSLGREVLFLHGGVPRKKRDELIARFQHEGSAAESSGLSFPPIFIISLKAGGVGLNLTQANHVFHFDRWWNPAVENQATDRAFRIGQKRNVQVHKLISVGTLEEMIDTMIERKRELAENILGTGEGWLTELSTEELREVLTLRRDAVSG